jgi:hypothetical protein
MKHIGVRLLHSQQDLLGCILLEVTQYLFDGMILANFQDQVDMIGN